MVTNQDVKDALYAVVDPEIGVNIMDLGLVYRVNVVEGKVAEVDFTLTTPGCPLGEIIAGDIVKQVMKQTDVNDVRVNIVWSPRWNETMLSENARLMLGYPI